MSIKIALQNLKGSLHITTKNYLMFQIPTKCGIYEELCKVYSKGEMFSYPPPPPRIDFLKLCMLLKTIGDTT